MKAPILLMLLAASAAARDFDHDGREDRIVVVEGKARVESAEGGLWTDNPDVGGGS